MIGSSVAVPSLAALSIDYDLPHRLFISIWAFILWVGRTEPRMADDSLSFPLFLGQIVGFDAVIAIRAS
jgi:hypothetical protein